MEYKREINVDNIIYDVGDIVNLPFDEVGVIKSIDNAIIWGFRYIVEIIESDGIFNYVGDIVNFKSSQFK